MFYTFFTHFFHMFYTCFTHSLHIFLHNFYTFFYTFFTHFSHIFYTLCTHFLHIFFTHFLHIFATFFTHFLHMFYTFFYTFFTHFLYTFFVHIFRTHFLYTFFDGKIQKKSRHKYISKTKVQEKYQITYSSTYKIQKRYRKDTEKMQKCGGGLTAAPTKGGPPFVITFFIFCIGFVFVPNRFLYWCLLVFVLASVYLCIAFCALLVPVHLFFFQVHPKKGYKNHKNPRKKSLTMSKKVKQKVNKNL